MKKKVRYSTATYKTKDGNECDLVELAKIYSEVGNIPEKVGNIKAAEIALLARVFLSLYEEVGLI